MTEAIFVHDNKSILFVIEAIFMHDKKAKKKHIGIKNQKNFLSVFIANKKKKIPANEKKVEK